ncbi:M48 family metallopeptidase [Stenotrophomonas sp. MMGLT7]|uniref:M48 family metallopeptidase n=1 Tax=Stenotrophomonas sp. MMGLT7 TaxID=2901227 RepID=UPI001E4FE0D5|nr:M48 family metallopeptidase [Stenotrophomonas sp. MMGLT7]MCD7099879.1 M48 family metallopeptidase [Stenotrophomonas sp. MMGLT7]
MSDKENAIPAGAVPFRLILVAIVLPLLLAAIGVGEQYRQRQLLSTQQDIRRDLDATMAERLALEKRDPEAEVTLDDGRSMGVHTAYLVAELHSQAFVRSERLAAVQSLLPPLVIAAGGLCALGSALFLVLTLRAARAGRRSRDALVAGFRRIRRLLPWQMGGQIALTALAALAIVGYEVLSLWQSGALSLAIPPISIALALAGLMILALAAGALRVLRQAMRALAPEPMPLPARTLSEAEAPQLWALVDGLARQAGTERPAQIAVGLSEGFFVTEGELSLLPERRLLRGRTLYLNLPLLAVIDADELRAIVGHELAHFSGDDTAYSRRFVPLYAQMERSVAAVADAHSGSRYDTLLLQPALLLGTFVLERFDAAVKHWSREREFRADAKGAGWVSAQAAATALLRSAALAPAIEHAVRTALDAGDGRRASSLLAELAGRLSPQALLANLDDRQPHPTDSHPLLGQRISALGLQPEAALAEAALDGARRGPDAATSACLPPALEPQLLDDLRAIGDEVDAHHRQLLEEAAGAVDAAAVEIHEDIGRAFAIVLITGVVLSGWGLYALATMHGQASGSAETLGRGTIALFSGVVAIVAAMAGRRRARRPLAVLTPETLRLRGVEQPLNWLDVEDLSVFNGGRRLLTGFELRAEVALPRARGGNCRADKRAHCLVLRAAGIRGLSEDAWLEMLERYLQAARARLALAERARQDAGQ